MRRDCWKEVRLGDHVEVQTGFPFKSKEYTEEPTGIALLRGDNIVQGKLRWEGVKRWPANDSINYIKYLLREDDVVLAMDRPWIEAGLKYAWITKRDLPCLLVQRVSRLRGTNGLSTQFARYIIGHHSFTDYVKGIWTGVAVPHISESQIRSFRFLLPPPPAQARITEILSAYDDLIENNTRRIKILEQMAQMLYREWFVNFRFPGHEKVSMVESEIGQIPATWSALPMNDIVTEIIDYRGKTPKKLGSAWADDGVIALSALNVKQGRLESLDKAKRVDDYLYERWMKSELDEGDILMTSEAPLGEVYILTEKKKYCLSQRLFSIRANPRCIFPSLLYLFLGSHGGQEQIKSRSTGTTVLGIRQSELRKIVVPVPESGVQARMNSTAWPLLKQIDVLALKNENLRATRDLLLPKLVSGEISVEQIEEEAVAEMV